MEGMAEAKVKHIRNYARVRKMINDHYDKDIADTKAEIEKVEREGWPEDSWGTKESFLDRQRDRLRPPKVMKDGTVKPFKDTIAYWRQRDLDRLDAADRAGVVTEVTFKIGWSGTRASCETWVHYMGEPQDFIKDRVRRPLRFSDGNKAMVSVHYNPRTSAGGHGYCKRSTVMSEGIQCPAIDRLVIEHRKCWGCYAVEGKDSLPHLSFGGKGVETLRHVFDDGYREKAPIPGFSWMWQEGKTWDFINIARRSNGRRKG